MVGRLLALVVAVAMVVGSLALRSRIDKGNEVRRLTCSSELAAVCNGIGHGVRITIEPAGTTADRLVGLSPGDDAGLDGWLVAGPWPAMVDAARQASARDPLFGGRSEPLASSPLALVVESRRAGALAKACTPLSWPCVATAATKQWQDLGGPSFATFGAVKADIPDPASSAGGVAVLGAISDGLFTGRDFARDDDRLRSALAGLRRVATQPGPDAVTTVLTAAAVTDTVATTEAEALGVLDQAANRNAVAVLYPSAVVVDVELGSVGTGGPTTNLAALVRGSAGRDALTTAHWKLGPPAAGTTTDSGVLAALRAAWRGQ
ncbi:MAG: hypothetical protein QOG64_1097 [Acidimicrobiaceae bacterium]|jgi:hypothetical protein|nr:hypothetical protein [Acidimicrobiaceae bacterium]